MGTNASTMEYLLDQLSSLDSVRARKMFGEYALYYDRKVVALICDDQLFVKPTGAGRELLVSPSFATPYPGAKPYFLIHMEECEHRVWLSKLIQVTAAALPLPKAKRT